MIADKQRVEVYARALDHFGEENQLVVALEELSECQKEICKTLRGYCDVNHLSEEIADSLIMLEQVIYIFGLECMVSREMDRKVKRLEDRISRRAEK